MIRLATAKDAIIIARNLRREDALEAEALAGVSPSVLMKKSFSNSMESWVWVKDDEPGAIWGVAMDSIIGGTAQIWLVSTPVVDRYPIEFLRSSRKVLEVLQTRYPVLENWVDARYVKCIRWLEWLGFTMGEAEPFGVQGLPFHKFRLG